MKIYVCGDTHGSHDIHKLNSNFWTEQKDLTEDALLIILGDFGLVWANGDYTNEERYWLNWLLDKPCQIAFLDGNHESFAKLETYPITHKWGGKVQEVFTNSSGKSVYHLMRGEIFEFVDEYLATQKVFVMGGAKSVDKAFRTEFISWWEGENITHSEIENALDNLSEVDYYVDYILTHTCPDHLIASLEDIRKFNDPNSLVLQDIFEKVTFKEWHFGHFHMDVKLNNCYCHYNRKPRRII